MLPEGVSIIRIEDRDWDDNYFIGSGRTFCFEFLLEPNDPDYVYPENHLHGEKYPGHCEPYEYKPKWHPGSPGSYVWIEAIHDKPTAQDLSLRCWFSTTPYGQQFFPPSQDNMDIFPLVRQARTILVGSETTLAPHHMPVGINYIMVKNLQNADNIFKISFREHPIGA